MTPAATITAVWILSLTGACGMAWMAARFWGSYRWPAGRTHYRTMRKDHERD